VLGEYIKEGVEELDISKLPGLLGLKYGNVNDAVAQLGSIPMIRETFVGFQRHLYVRL
jgi:type I restriction enzyme R subunit